MKLHGRVSVAGLTHDGARSYAEHVGRGGVPTDKLTVKAFILRAAKARLHRRVGDELHIAAEQHAVFNKRANAV